MRRAAIFVDVPSLWFNARRFGNGFGRVDYRKLRERMFVGEKTRVGSYAYVWERPGMESFIRALWHIGYAVKLVPQSQPAGLAIAADIEQMIQENLIDEVILATGEGDYSAQFSAIRRHGKVRVEVHAFPVGSQIIDIASYVDCYLSLGGDVLELSQQRTG